MPAPLAEAAALTTAATLGTAPLLALHFERVSIVSLPANLLAVPAVAPVMWLGMLAVAAGAVIPGAPTLLNALAQYPLAYLGGLAHAAAAVPAASVAARVPSPAALAPPTRRSPSWPWRSCAEGGRAGPRWSPWRSPSRGWRRCLRAAASGRAARSA